MAYLKKISNYILIGISIHFLLFFVIMKNVSAFSSHQGISASREFEVTTADQGEAIKSTFRLNNTEDIISGFYYTEHIPAHFTVETISVRIFEYFENWYLFHEITDYTYEIGLEADVYDGCIPHRWVIETPPNFVENHKIGINSDAETFEIEIIYTISSQMKGDFTLPGYNWVGKLGTNSSPFFGYGDGDEIIHIYPTPIANFRPSATTGYPPLIINFTDESTGDISSWTWNFGDDQTSFEQNPTHEYLTSGTYTVSLTVSGPGGTDMKTSLDLIIVTNLPINTPIAAFSSTPISGPSPSTINFTDESTGLITSWTWDFGDGQTSSEQNPTHDYLTSGTYTVTLTISGPGGTDVKTSEDFITIVDRIDLDMIIKQHKEGTVSDEEVKDLIKKYYGIQ